MSVGDHKILLAVQYNAAGKEYTFNHVQVVGKGDRGHLRWQHATGQFHLSSIIQCLGNDITDYFKIRIG